MTHRDVVICIPTTRPPPVITLEHHDVDMFEVLIIADPKVYEQHREYYRGDGPWTVIKGAVGMVPQVAECYTQAHSAGYHWYFRADDDLGPKTFVNLLARKTYVPLADAIRAAYDCLFETRTNLAGFENGTMTWGRKIIQENRATYGLIHGGAHICCTTRNPSRYIDLSLHHFEDVYRSRRMRRRGPGQVDWPG
jgi:hypothetical protein